MLFFESKITTWKKKKTFNDKINIQRQNQVYSWKQNIFGITPFLFSDIHKHQTRTTTNGTQKVRITTSAIHRLENNNRRFTDCKTAHFEETKINNRTDIDTAEFSTRGFCFNYTFCHSRWKYFFFFFLLAGPLLSNWNL